MSISTQAPGMAARFVGQRVPRKEDRRLLTGRGSYVDDIVLPGMLEVAFHRSQVARARIRGVDLEAARTIPGVRAIFTAENLEAAREWDIKVRLAFDADARLLAADVDYQTNVGAWPIMVDAGGLTMLMFPGPYRLPKLAFQGRAWYSNTAGMAAYRGPWLSETVGREALMDKAARQIGICPVELRRRNMVTREEQPHTHPTGIEIRNVTPRETPG